VTTRQPSFVLFDLGNVLVSIHPEAFLQVLGIDTPENRRFYQSYVNDIVRAYERGAESTDQFFDRLDRLFNAREGGLPRHGNPKVFSQEDLRRAMLAVIGRPIAGMEDIVRRVSSIVPVGLLSNTNPLHYNSCLETVKCLRYIPTHFLSFKLKSLKPDPSIYRQVIQELRLPPADVLYIDDVPQNVEGARAVGITCHVFDGREPLVRRLGELQVI